MHDVVDCWRRAERRARAEGGICVDYSTVMNNSVDTNNKMQSQCPIRGTVPSKVPLESIFLQRLRLRTALANLGLLH